MVTKKAKHLFEDNAFILMQNWKPVMKLNWKNILRKYRSKPNDGRIGNQSYSSTCNPIPEYAGENIKGLKEIGMKECCLCQSKADIWKKFQNISMQD